MILKKPLILRRGGLRMVDQLKPWKKGERVYYLMNSRELHEAYPYGFEPPQVSVPQTAYVANKAIEKMLGGGR